MFENVYESISQDWMLITAGNKDKVNTMTASWGAIGYIWGKKCAFIVIRPQRYTKEFVDSNEYFSLSFFDEKYKKDLTYLGTVSGRDEDKISKTNLNIEFKNSVPYFKEATNVLICKKLYAQEMKEDCFIDKEIISQWFPQKDYHTLYVAEILNHTISNKNIF